MIKLQALTVAVMCTTFDVSAWFYCHGDFCNEETDFCSHEFQMCRPCEEVLDNCLTNRLPKNCTRVCIQEKFQEQMKKERERKCVKPKILLNGSHNGSQKELYDQGDVITATCDLGYRLASNNNITCREFGVWSNDLPVCEEITCPHPSIIRNGFWSSRNPNVTHLAGDKIEAVCDQGYLMNGKAIWNCSNDGNWISSDSYFPVCHLTVKTEVDYWSTVLLPISLFISICTNFALAICLKRERRKQKGKRKQHKQHKQCKEKTDFIENSRLLESKNDTAGTISLWDQKGQKGTTSLTRQDLPRPNVSSMQCNMEEPQPKPRTSTDNAAHRPDTQPQTGYKEDKSPRQRESSNENINENGHDTSRKTIPNDTCDEFMSINDQSFSFPEQQAANNEQDLDRKMAITSKDITINLEDIAQRRFGSVGH